MISIWRPVLRFYFASVGPEVTSDELEELEKSVNGALLPPLSIRDIEATIKTKKRAFR
jgi:hypothetical protein